jgi:hypothetical protein
MTHEEAYKIARTVAWRNRGMFFHFKQYAVHDLSMEAYFAMVAAMPKVDHAKSKASTFLWRVGHTYLISLYRKCVKERERENAYAMTDPINKPLPVEPIYALRKHRIKSRALCAMCRYRKAGDWAYVFLASFANGRSIGCAARDAGQTQAFVCRRLREDDEFESQYQIAREKAQDPDAWAIRITQKPKKYPRRNVIDALEYLQRRDAGMSVAEAYA